MLKLLVKKLFHNIEDEDLSIEEIIFRLNRTNLKYNAKANNIPVTLYYPPLLNDKYGIRSPFVKRGVVRPEQFEKV